MSKVGPMVLLLVLAGGLVHAELYRCREASGRLVFADNPAQLPAGCKAEQIEAVPLQVIETETPATVAPGTSSAPEVVSPTPGTEEEPVVEKDYASWKSQADGLVAQFVDARQKAYHSAYIRDKRAGRQQLKEIRTQKDQMLAEIHTSGLKPEEVEALRKILSAITAAE